MHPGTCTCTSTCTTKQNKPQIVMILHLVKNANYSFDGLFRITVEYIFDCVEFLVMI